MREPLGVADETAVAPEGCAELGRHELRLRRWRDIGQPCGKDGLAERGESRAPPEDEALEQRVRRKSVRAVDAGRRALTRRVQTRELAAPVEIREDASDGVVRSGRDRDRRLRRVVALLEEAAHQRREASTIDRAQVEKDGAAGSDLARDDVARRELVGESVALIVEQDRTLSAQRLREEERRVHERRRVELDELEVGERSADAVRGGHSLTHRACRDSSSAPRARPRRRWREASRARRQRADRSRRRRSDRRRARRRASSPPRRQ